MKIIAALAGALLLCLAGDAAAVVHLRAEQAERAAERAAARADAEWVAAVRDVGAAVELAHRPLQQALDLDLPETDVDDGVRYDVYVSGAVQAELQVHLDALTALPVPEPRRRVHAAFVDQLTRMKDRTTSMAAPEQDDFSFDVDAEELQRAIDGFRSGLEMQGATAPEPPPEPASRAGMLYAWGEVCARAVDAYEDLPDGEDLPLAEVRAGLRQEADLLEGLVRDLLAVPPVAADVSRIENEVLVPLRGLAPSAAALRDLDAALGAEDADALEAALVALDRTAPALELATRGLDGYGSSTCATFFDPGVLLGEPEGSGEPEARTA